MVKEENPLIGAYSKRKNYDKDYSLKFRMNSSVEKYLNISENLEELKKIVEKEKEFKEITKKIQRLEKFKKEYKGEYIKDYRKLKNKKGVKTWEEIKKIFPEYLEIKKIKKIFLKNSRKNFLKKDYKYKQKHFFGTKITYNISKEILDNVDNIYLISIENQPYSIQNFYNFSFRDFLNQKNMNKTIEKFFSVKDINLVKKIKSEKGEIINIKSGEIYYDLVLEKGNSFVSIGNIFVGKPYYFEKDNINKEEITRIKTRFFENLNRKNYNKIYVRFEEQNKDLITYMKKFLRKKLEVIENLENKEKFLIAIEKVIKNISKGKKDKIEKLMESFTSDDQIEEISREFDKINRKSEIFSLFLNVIEEEIKILDFKNIENLILK